MASLPVSSDTAFQFEGRNVRLVEQDGETWFVATDVARELGYRDAADLTRSLDVDEKGTHTLRTLGGDQVIAIISEPGVYRAIIQRRTNKKHDESLTAKLTRFQRFVFHDVLPSIRATGSYSAAPPAPVHTLPQSFADALQLAADQARRIELQQAEIATLAPKGEAYDRFLNADGLIGLQNVGRALQCHPNLFIKGLIPDYCFRDARGTVVARQVSVDRGLFVNKPYDAPNGKVYLRAFMTTKGLDYFSTRIPAGTENRKHQTVPAIAAGATAH